MRRGNERQRNWKEWEGGERNKTDSKAEEGEEEGSLMDVRCLRMIQSKLTSH